MDEALKERFVKRMKEFFKTDLKGPIDVLFEGRFYRCSKDFEAEPIDRPRGYMVLASEPKFGLYEGAKVYFTAGVVFKMPMVIDYVKDGEYVVAKVDSPDSAHHGLAEVYEWAEVEEGVFKPRKDGDG